MGRVGLTTIGTLGVLLAATLAGILVGPADLALRGVVVELIDRLPLVTVDSGLDDRAAAILWQIRLPRVVLGLLVGATLSLAGGAYQGVFRNPLADPYLLGAAAGAGLGATVVIALDVQAGWGPFDTLPALAFLGALGAVACAYVAGSTNAFAVAADTGNGQAASRSATTLVLAGVAIASLFTAIQTFVQQRDRESVQEVYSWILGRLSTGGWGEVRLLAPFTVVAAAGILAHRRSLDVLAVGDEEATALGLRVDRTRLWVVVAASLGTAAAVSVSGLIGFVGIIVPHTIRLLVGRHSFRVILPLALLGGAAFLVLSDLVARTVLEPAEIPIGVVTALVGAPFFLLLLARGRMA
ncbi:MAG: FecCD family ABC transporter permease [Acidimicrobiales bacterium]